MAVRQDQTGPPAGGNTNRLAFVKTTSQQDRQSDRRLPLSPGEIERERDRQTDREGIGEREKRERTRAREREKEEMLTFAFCLAALALGARGDPIYGYAEDLELVDYNAAQPR